MDQLVVVPVETVGVVVGAAAEEEEEEEELAETRVAARVEVVGKLAEEDLGPATAEEGTADLEARELDRAGDLEDAVTAEVVAGNSSSSLICDDGVAQD